MPKTISDRSILKLTILAPAIKIGLLGRIGALVGTRVTFMKMKENLKK